MNYWLVKQESTAYSWDQFVADGKTAWTGVRNFQARNNLKAMRKGDRAFFYHSNTGKEIVGVVEVLGGFLTGIRPCRDPAEQQLYVPLSAAGLRVDRPRGGRDENRADTRTEAGGRGLRFVGPVRKPQWRRAELDAGGRLQRLNAEGQGLRPGDESKGRPLLAAG